MKFLKRHPLAGLFLGVALISIGLLSLPFASESADAASAASCPIARVTLDDGYGLSRTAYRPACP